jgi:preprotein translocase subunit SecA
MTTKIASDVAQTILRISVRTAEQAEQDEKDKAAAEATHQHNRTTTSANAAPQGDRTTNTRTTAGDGRAAPANPNRLGRNDPCWCGSGKKYKKCHGR